MRITKIALTLILVIGASALQAQVYSYNEFAKTFSTLNTAGTARFQALGGSHTALGADITSAASNPAGLGFYTKSEFVAGLGITALSTNTNYFTTNTSDNKSIVNVPSFGLVLANDFHRGDNWKGAFSISYSRQVNLHSNIAFQGVNTKSSLLDNVVESANGRNLDKEYNDNAHQPTSFESLFYNAYLVDPIKGKTNQYTNVLQDNTVANQTGTVTSVGSISQWNLGYGAGYQDKVYFGMSVGLSNLRYDTKMNFSERYTNSKYVNGIAYDENRLLTGSGLNVSGGVIFRPTPALRLGVSVTSPTWYSAIQESTDATLKTDVVPNAIVDGTTGKTIAKVDPITLYPRDFEFQLTTPLKASAGMAYFFSKSGFLSVDAEYVGYGGMNLGANALTASDNAAFKTTYNGRIKTAYQDVINLKTGAEFRTGIMSFRGGVGYFADPYRSNTTGTLNRGNLQFSGGIGIKTEGFYVDLAVVNTNYDSAYTPYTLKNTADYASAKITNSMTNVMVSVGFYL